MSCREFLISKGLREISKQVSDEEVERRMRNKARWVGGSSALGGVPGGAISGAVTAPSEHKASGAAYSVLSSAAGGAGTGLAGYALANRLAEKGKNKAALLAAGVSPLIGTTAGGLVGHRAHKRKYKDAYEASLRGVSKREARLDDFAYSGEEMRSVKRDKPRAAMAYGGAGAFLGGLGALGYETTGRGGYVLPPVRGKVLAGGGAATLGGLGLMVGAKLREKKVANRVRVAQGKAPRDWYGIPKDFYDSAPVNKKASHALLIPVPKKVSA